MSPAKTMRFITAERQCGVTLIETLIAAVILAIGILGIVSLLTLAKVSQHESMQRVRAVGLATAMLERIRRNPAAAASYHRGFDSPIGGASIEDEPVACTTDATCTAAEMAQRDLWAWEQRLDGELVSVTDAAGNTLNTAALQSLRACIDFEADSALSKANTGVVSVVLQWRGLRDSTDAVAAGEDVCGGATAGEDPARRQVIVSTYVVDERELLN